VQLCQGVEHSSGIFGATWIGFIISNHPAVCWQQVGDTAAALGLGWVGEGRVPDGAKRPMAQYLPTNLVMNSITLFM
jgi:hypothetical protein